MVSGRGVPPAAAQARERVERAQALDVRELVRRGLPEPGFRSEWYIGERARHDRPMLVSLSSEDVHVRLLPEGQGTAKTILLVTTPCHLGGARRWFQCPGCARRVAILYRDGTAFRCRRCAELAYSSQLERPGARAFRNADRLRKRLGWWPGVLLGWGGKPKGMHWQTFGRLTARYQEVEREALACHAHGLDRVMRDLDAVARCIQHLQGSSAQTAAAPSAQKPRQTRRPAPDRKLHRAESVDLR